MKILRLVFVLFIFVTGTAPATAQTTTSTDLSFRISDTGTIQPEDVQAYLQALQKADLDRYRFRAKSNFIRFETGVEVEIFSAEWCSLHGVSIKSSHIRDDAQNYDDGVFALGANGMIVEKKTYQYKTTSH